MSQPETHPSQDGQDAPPPDHRATARHLVAVLLARHDLRKQTFYPGGTIIDHDRLDRIFHSQHELILDLVAAGLATGKIPF
ncbi:MAG: hypothetical protein MJH10_15780 [Epibacterium sp.]|nr:hypothetical protein [Epibacterium sp.]NQX74978.1 hypothetical protein [Epibacterium sp.]